MIRAVARSILVVSVLVGGVAVAAPANKPVAAATTKQKAHHRAKAHKVAKVKKARKHLAKPHRSHKS